MKLRFIPFFIAPLFCKQPDQTACTGFSILHTGARTLADEGNPMEVPILILLTTLTLAAAFYAHSRLPTQTRSTASLWFSRLILGLIGIGFGWVMSAFYYPS